MEFKVDARGLACPLPVVNTKNEIAKMSESGVVTVLVDNEIAVQNLTKFAKQKNYAVSSQKTGDNVYEVIITVDKSANQSADQNFAQNGGSADGNGGNMADDRADHAEGTVGEKKADNTTADEICCQPDIRKKGQLVVLSANVMGTGDEKLGKNLMKAFVFALTQQDRLPESILLYNSGAFLSCEGSDSLEDLKKLEAEGVEILTCGTCLNFYGLTEKLGVGGVTNMYDIVEHMQKAASVIRP